MGAKLSRKEVPLGSQELALQRKVTPGLAATGPWFVDKGTDHVIASHGVDGGHKDDPADIVLSDVLAYDPIILRNNSMTPIVCAMAIMGVMPIVIKSPRLFFRSTLPLCIILYLIFVASAVLLLTYNLPVMFAKDVDLDSRMVATELVVHLSPILWVPVIWSQSRNICSRTCDFFRLKRMVQKVSSTALRRDAHRRTCLYAMTVVILVFTVLITVGAYVSVVELHMTILQLPGILYAIVIQTLIWWNVAIQLVHLLATAQTLRRQFQQLQGPRGTDAASVRAFRLIWIELREMIGYDDCLTDAVYVAHLLYLLVQGTMTAFETLSFCVAGRFWATLAHGIFCTIYLVEICFMCDFAHRVVTEMRDPFVATLDRLSARELDEETYSEICFFYKTIIAKAPDYSVRGYATMDRPTLAAIITTILSYIIFLAQFEGNHEKTLVEKVIT